MKHGRSWGSILATAIFIVAELASAQEPVASIEADRMRNQIVGSMRLTGTLAVTEGGTISGYVIDHSEKVPAEVLQHVVRFLPRWRVMGTETAGNKRFSVRVMATPRGDGYFALSLVGASINEKQHPDEAVVADGRLRKPDYPRALGRIGVSGTVYAAAKIGREGEVQDLVIEQVNLNFIGSPAEVAKARADFAAHTAAAVRQWRFRVPKAGPYLDQPYLVVRVPVDYVAKRRAYAEWEYYVPGPRRALPWLHDDGMALGAGEAGVPQVVGMGPRIQTSLEPPAG